MKKLLAVLLAVLMLSLCATALAEGTLTMGSNCSFPPFEYIDDNGDPAGFDVEIGRLVAEKLGMDFKVEDMAFDGLIAALDGGKIDMVIAGMTITPERQEQVDFSDSYFNAQQQVIVRAGTEDIKTADDLLDKTIAVQDGTTGHIYVTDTLGLPADQISAFKSAADAVLELKSGRADAFIIDTAPANVFVSMNDDLVILDGFDMPVEDYGIAFKQGNTEMVDAANAVLAEIKADGTYDALVAEYFAE